MSSDTSSTDRLELSPSVLVAIGIVTVGLVAMSFSPSPGCEVTSTPAADTTTTTEASR